MRYKKVNLDKIAEAIMNLKPAHNHMNRYAKNSALKKNHFIIAPFVIAKFIIIIIIIATNILVLI